MVFTKKGSVLGSYRIVRPLGKGGEGRVYLCVHERTKQFWALKILDGPWKKGKHEMEMMKRLSHPSLPRIIDLFQTETEDASCRAVLVMEYVHGVCLEDCIHSDRRLTEEQVMDIALQLSSLLVYLHGRKVPILHLDLKPSNMIISGQGRLCLTDFGSALKMDEGSTSFRSGTDGYAAPEQYSLTGNLSGRTDIYGMGAVLYRLISGVKYSPVLHGARIPACGDALEPVIRKCLETDPEDRYSNPGQVLRELKRIQRKRHAEKTRIRFWAAAWLGIAAAYAALPGLGREMAAPVFIEKEYQSLLKEALCAPEEELQNLYQEAIYMHPEGKEAWLSYIAWKDRDGILSEEEDRQLRMMLHSIPAGTGQTYEEILASQPEAYGEVAASLGILYWYDYRGDGAVRIAQGWFRKAAETDLHAQKDPLWKKTARLYAHIGSYTESFGASDGNRGGEDSAFLYWEDTGKLLEENEMDLFDERKQLLLYQSCLNRMIMDAGKLSARGVPVSELEERLKLLTEKTEKLQSLTGEELLAVQNSLNEAGEVLQYLK